uniref:Telomeric repeat binding factor 1 n=1 Tax=Leptobrachium leishanense TaxID=445787 RepID=A0A8C5MAE7_9ANUR
MFLGFFFSSSDSQFELDERLTPLESAVSVLEQIKEKEEPLVNLLNDIERSVKVQAVAVCMEKGRFKQSTEILDQQFPEAESDKYLRMKLAMIINKRDAYHEFLQHFSYKKMLAKIKSYLDLTLKEKPSPFLIKVASKVIEAKADRPVETQSMEVDDGFMMNERLTEDELSCSTEYTIARNPKIQPEEESAPENSSSEIEQVATPNTSDHNSNLIKPVNDPNEVTRDKGPGRLQKRLLSLESHTPWYPGKSCDLKKQMQPLKQGKRSREFEKSVKANLPLHASSKRKQPWIWEEDTLLRKGVKKYGVGNWSKILVHFEFNNRTSVMLKDRWRTMRKLNIVGSEDET